MKILVVDDSKILRQRIIGMISNIRGIEISGEAVNSTEALNLIEKLKPDIVILDIRMPNGSGIEVLKDTQKLGKTPIKIVLTNYPILQYKQKCMELGAHYFFDKATEIEEVREVIMNLHDEFTENEK